MKIQEAFKDTISLENSIWSPTINLEEENSKQAKKRKKKQFTRNRAVRTPVVENNVEKHCFCVHARSVCISDKKHQTALCCFSQLEMILLTIILLKSTLLLKNGLVHLSILMIRYPQSYVSSKQSWTCNQFIDKERHNNKHNINQNHIYLESNLSKYPNQMAKTKERGIQRRGTRDLVVLKGTNHVRWSWTDGDLEGDWVHKTRWVQKGYVWII